MKVKFRIKFPELETLKGINIYSNVGFYEIKKEGKRHIVFYEGRKIGKTYFLFIAKNIVKESIRKRILNKINK